MGRPVSFDFTTGGGSAADFLMGEILAEPTAMHNLGSTIVLPDPVNVPLINGKATHPDMAVSPDGPDPLWCYKFTITSHTGRSWVEYRGVIAGEGTAVYRYLPKYHAGPNPPELSATVEYLVTQAIAEGSTVADAAAAAVGTALADARVLASTGEDTLIIRGENHTDTWLQAAPYTDAGGIAGPTGQTVAAIARAGIPRVVDSAPPPTLDLAPGETIIYLNNGEPVLAVGS